jgi:hypothetical protein
VKGYGIVVLLAALMFGSGCLGLGPSPKCNDFGVDCLDEKNIGVCRGQYGLCSGYGIWDTAYIKPSEYYTVVGTQDPYLCQIFKRGLNEECFRDIGKTHNDKSRCDRIEGIEYRCGCYVGMGQTDRPETCVIYENAKKAGVDASCVYEDYNSSEDGYADCYACYAPIALKMRDSSLCGICYPYWPQHMSNCSRQIAYAYNDPEFCGEDLEANECFYKIAVARNESGICDRIYEGFEGEYNSRSTCLAAVQRAG